MTMFKFLEGKRTYATMAVIIILAVINAWNGYCQGLAVVPSYCVSIAVPEWVFAILAALGIYTRAIAKPAAPK